MRKPWYVTHLFKYVFLVCALCIYSCQTNVWMWDALQTEVSVPVDGMKHWVCPTRLEKVLPQGLN